MENFQTIKSINKKNIALYSMWKKRTQNNWIRYENLWAFKTKWIVWIKENEISTYLLGKWNLKANKEWQNRWILKF
jgi:hypothetical protein